MSLLLIGLGLGLAGTAAGALLSPRRRVPAAAVLGSGACVVAFVAAGRALVSGQTSTFRSVELLPLTGVRLSLDPLAALFIVTTAVVGLAALCYGVGYTEGGPRSRTATAMLPAFLTSLLLVPAAASVATFMVAWELMALTSTLLLLVEHRHRAEARDAAQWYGAMTHVGAAAILLGLLLLASRAGGQTFAAIGLRAGAMSPTTRSLAFVLVLVGFASKAGAVPFHVWLPRAHPEAPSPVSALMSAAMVNLGIYGIVRVGDGLLGGGVLWWWLVVVGLGVASALFGALHAAASSDLKRLLAYSTVDNVGLVLIGVGAAGALEVTGHRALAALAMLAALFHLVNHAAFKGCLFLGAGAVQQASGSRDLDRLGGLVHRLPLTALLFGVGALSISALPPFNGFASEWLLLEGLLHGFAAHSAATTTALLAGVAALALTGGLTAAAFVKALGIGFLGQPRTPAAANAREVAPSMLAGMAMLAAPCLLLGIVPGSVVPMLRRAADTGLGDTFARPLRADLGLNLAGFEGAIEPVLLLAAFVGALVVAWASVRLFARRGARRAEAWGCGRELQTARMEYTATSFAEPLQRVFADVLRPDHDLEVTHVAESRYFRQAISYHSRVDDALERTCYRPVIRLVEAWGGFARRAQNGNLHRYLAFGLVALVALLVVLA
ncbi:MAG TPA: proton-conducting transporter membrane subunit [Acidimicrobiales bacterium]|nr:proton-conducting transporter membrane subunit [Acidimicrobiales bacterium]